MSVQKSDLAKPEPEHSLPREDLAAERRFLRDCTKSYPEIESETEHALRRAIVRLTRSLLPRRAHVLELGCADGYMARLLAPSVERHVVVDAVTFPSTRLPPSAEFHQSLFEEYEPAERFDLVIMSLVLEHVLDPVELMARGRAWLRSETGHVVAIVPNIRALSRQLARAMGIIRELDDLTPNDRAHGHRRCYDRASFDRNIVAAGGEILLRGGLLLKPFANFQMDRMIEADVIGREQLDGLETLGADYADLCTAFYAVFR